MVPIMLAARTRRAEFSAEQPLQRQSLFQIQYFAGRQNWGGAQDVAPLKPLNMESQAEKGF
ncbi:hypothetical protein HED50_17335 [Ochrobactrum oryzae]|nr:hypothetical protein [Brucella oryzae]